MPTQIIRTDSVQCPIDWIEKSKDNKEVEVIHLKGHLHCNQIDDAVLFPFDMRMKGLISGLNSKQVARMYLSNAWLMLAYLEKIGYDCQTTTV